MRATLAAVLMACVGAAHGGACVWNATRPDTVGARHDFRVDCEPAGLAYAWDFGDGSRAVTDVPAAAHAYAAPGQYVILVRVAMADGDTLSVLGGQIAYRPVTASRPAHATPILFDASRSRIWTVNPDNHSAVYIDWPSGARSPEFPVGRRPRTLAQDRRGDIWVCGQEDASLTLLEGATGRTLRTLALPRASRPYAVVVDSARDLAYVTLQATGRLLKFDAASKTLLGDIEAIPSARGLAVSHDGLRILVTRFISGPEQGAIAEVDGAAFKLKRVIPLAFDKTPDSDVSGSGIPNAVNSVAFTPDGREAWYTAKKDNVGRGLFRNGRAFTEENTARSIVGRLDPAAGAEDMARRKDLDNRNMPKALAFGPDGVLAFIASEGSNTVDVFNVPGSERAGTIEPHGLEHELAPQGLAVHPEGGLLFVQYFTSREVGVYDLSTAGTFNDFKRVALIRTIGADSLGEQAAQGQRVFYNSADLRMTRSNYVSCSTCHPEGGEDGRTWDFTERGEGLRNTTTLLGKGGPDAGPFHWSANFDEIQDFEHDIRGPQRGLGFMADADFSGGTRGTPLGDAKAGISPELDALAAYLRTLVQAPRSPYRAADGGLTPAGRRGRDVFARAETGCALCHGGPRFSDSGPARKDDPLSPYAPFHAAVASPGGFILHDVGTMGPGSGKRLNDSLEGLDSPTLQGIWATAPYMHDGSAPTLMDVLEGRNAGDRHGKTSSLTPAEKEDLVAYLLQIDGTPEEPSSVRPGIAGRGRPARRLHPKEAWVGMGVLGRPVPPGVQGARVSVEKRSGSPRVVPGTRP